MKTMSLGKQIISSGGSVRCNYCGWTTWALTSMRAHQRNSHRGRDYDYNWYTFGPYNRYTKAWEHWGYRGHNC